MTVTDNELGQAPDFEELLSAEMAKRMVVVEQPRLFDDDPTSAPDPEPAVEPAPIPDTFDEPEPQPAAARLSVPIPGTDQTYDVDVDTAARLLSLAAWAENLPSNTREAFAAIETGTAVPVNRADYEQFVAWQRMRTSKQADTDFDDLDDDDLRRSAEIAELRAEVDRLRRQPLVDQYTAQTEQATVTFVSTAEQYAAERGLSEDEMAVVLNYAVEANVIPGIANSLRQYSPTGQLVRDADYTEVARRAFDFAMVNHPQFRGRTAPVPGNQPDPTAIKKARAGSLASAPSAAVTTPPIDVRQMSEADRRNAMAEELRAAMNGRM